MIVWYYYLICCVVLVVMLLLWMLVDFHGARERFVRSGKGNWIGSPREKTKNSEKLIITTQRSQVTDVGSLFFLSLLTTTGAARSSSEPPMEKKLFVH